MTAIALSRPPRRLRRASSVAALCLLGAVSPSIASDIARAVAIDPVLPRYDRVLQLEPKGETSANISFGDLNGDGHLDIVLAKGRHWPLVDRVLLGDGRGGIREAYDLGVASDKTYSGQLADLDGDGDLDVVISNDTPNANLVYLNDGRGRFTNSGSFGVAEWPTRNATVADVNGDGRPDIVVANRFGRTPGSNYVCLNRGGGQFEDPCVPFAAEPATTITVADFTSDGVPDLLVPHRNGGQGHLYVRARNAPLTGLRRIPFGPADATVRVAAAVDLDGDRRLDVVTVDEQRGVTASFGSGDGQFHSPVTLGDPRVVPYAITTGDLNNDGHQDIVVGFVQSATIAYINDGTGKKFIAVPFGDAQGAAYGIAIADFDADGVPDIGVARSDAPNVVYFGALTAPAAPAAASRAPLKLTYLGNAGWEITDGTTVVLVDPFLTQFARWEPGAVAAGPDPDALYVVDSARIDRHVKRADYIVITHGHSDHALDAGYIANRTAATIIGHETVANLARAYRVPEQQLITVHGGEDYDFGTFSLRVIPNIHSALDDKRYFNNGRDIAGTAPRGLTAPLRRRDYQEGGSLSYLVRMAGHEVLVMGSMNYIEREMQGLRPDVALVGANSQRLEVYDFTGRLLRALGYPALVIPTHADAYGNPNPTAAALADRELFRQEVLAASPQSRYLFPKWFEPIELPARETSAASRSAERRAINPPGISPLVPAYSVAVRDGEWVFVSGMTGFIPGSQDIVAGGIGPQTRQTMENIRAALVAAGASMADVGECTVYLRDMADYAAMNAEYIKFFDRDPPARATLAVTAFPRPAAVVEIKCSARVGGR
jgi:reactive intermediate/imine deaminase